MLKGATIGRLSSLRYVVARAGYSLRVTDCVMYTMYELYSHLTHRVILTVNVRDPIWMQL